MLATIATLWGGAVAVSNVAGLVQMLFSGARLLLSKQERQQDSNLTANHCFFW